MELQPRPKPSISVRRGMRWLPDILSKEDCLVLVLTSSQRYYIDIRLRIPSDITPVNPARLTDPAFFSWIHHHIAVEWDIDWAFAGTSTRVDGVGKWFHWVDCRTDDPESVVDEGTLTQHGTMELERGRALEPGAAVVREYEELWQDLEVSSQGRCTVLRSCNEEEGRGMIIRIGQYCQSMFCSKLHEDVVVERWEYTADDGWTQLMITDDDEYLNCPVIWEHAEELTVGRQIGYGATIWEVLENEEL